MTASSHNYPHIERRPTRSVDVGGVTIGGGAPVVVQSMTNTITADVDATCAQIDALAAVGCELVRVAAATQDDTAALPQVVARSPVPVIADVHFHFQRAIEAIQAGVAKIRLNPGNIADRDQVREVIAAAKAAGVAIRVGVNEGSIVERREGDQRAADLARPMDELMAEKLGEYLAVFGEADFDNLVLSAKSHDPVTTIAVNRRLAEAWDFPIHLGVTHAGLPEDAAVSSAAALGALLADGIGDTIRLSFTGDPVAEVRAAYQLLGSLRLRQRRGVELLACPTCGRAKMDIAKLAAEIRAALVDLDRPLTVAVMGCVVNGPGEAEGADVAVCAGDGRAILYSRGRKVRTVDADEISQAVLAEVARLTD
ncbi:MAG: flavodoxin-dependent (E)-4-hydroxy-3-methylbut-2-enyl-diphosphate synthase [Planctomycetota bacterium]